MDHATLWLLADEVDAKSSYGNLIFICLFLLAVIAVFVWWLRR